MVGGVPIFSDDVIRALPELMSLAEIRGGAGCDNLSVVAIAWGEEAPPLQPAATSPVTVPSYDLPTVQGAHAADPGAPEADMTDAEIERAIADIKAALQNYSHGKK